MRFGCVPDGWFWYCRLLSTLFITMYVLIFRSPGIDGSHLLNPELLWSTIDEVTVLYTNKVLINETLHGLPPATPS